MRLDTAVNLLCFGTPVLLVLAVWVWPLVTGRWRRPGWFFGTAGLCLVAIPVVWFVGAFSGGLDPEESCHLAGQAYDESYRAAHWREAARWFPLHNRCSAGYDLVPPWVNPALVVLPLLALACLGVASWLVVRRLRAR